MTDVPCAPCRPGHEHREDRKAWQTARGRGVWRQIDHSVSIPRHYSCASQPRAMPRVSKPLQGEAFRGDVTGTRPGQSWSLTLYRGRVSTECRLTRIDADAGSQVSGEPASRRCVHRRSGTDRCRRWHGLRQPAPRRLPGGCSRRRGPRSSSVSGPTLQATSAPTFRIVEGSRQVGRLMHAILLADLTTTLERVTDLRPRPPPGVRAATTSSASQSLRGRKSALEFLLARQFMPL